MYRPQITLLQLLVIVAMTSACSIQQNTIPPIQETDSSSPTPTRSSNETTTASTSTPFIATNTPYPTSIPTAVPTPTLAPIGEIQPIPDGFVYLGDKATLALGFNMRAGGALGSLLYNGRELVDYTDYGRYIQFSMYDSNDTYGPLGNDTYGNWGWNPIQAGSKAGGSSIIGAKVLEFRTAEGIFYIKSLGKEWGQYDQDSDIIYETWAWQRDGYFEVYTRATHTGDDTHAAYTQEFPAAYFATSLTHMVGYFGQAPFANAQITELDHVAREGEYAGTGNCPPVQATENWAAFGDSNGLGLILAVPPQTFLEPRWNICLLFDRPRVGYIGPIAYFDVPPQAVREMTYYLIPGMIETARGIVYDLIPHTSWTFDLNTLEGWRSNTNSASVTDGNASVFLSPNDWLTSHGALRVPAGITPSISLTGRTQDSSAEICMDFITTSDPLWSLEKSECLTITTGEYQTYEFSLQENPAWNGRVVTQLRLRAGSPTWLDIESLTAQTAGFAWEFEVPGDSEGWVAWYDLDPLMIMDGVLSSYANGNDPYLHSPGVQIDAAQYSIIELRMKVSAGGDAQLFFRTEQENDFVEEKSIIFTPITDGDFHTYTLDMSELEQWQGVITQLRLDPTNSKSPVEIDYIRVLGKP